MADPVPSGAVILADDRNPVHCGLVRAPERDHEHPGRQVWVAVLPPGTVLREVDDAWVFTLPAGVIVLFESFRPPV